MRKYEIAVYEEESVNGLRKLKVKGGQCCGPDWLIVYFYAAMGNGSSRVVISQVIAAKRQEQRVDDVCNRVKILMDLGVSAG